MWPRVAEPAEAQHLRAHEHEVTVGELCRLLDEHPRSVAGAEIANPELSAALFEPAMQRRHVRIALDANVAIAPAEDGLAALEHVRPGDLAFVVQESDARLSVSS